MLDAPVSGGEPKAIDGTLAIMVGGKEAVFEKVKDVLLKMGASAVLCGDIGAGNVTKLANQIIVALNIAAMSEAFVLATKAGVDPERVFNAIKGGLAGSTVLNAKAPMVLEGNYKPGFRIELHIKDLQNALDTAHETGTPIPLTSQIMEIMQALKVDGKQTDDHGGIIQFYEKLAQSKSARGAPSERDASFGQDRPGHWRSRRDRRGGRTEISRGRRLGVRLRHRIARREKRRPRRWERSSSRSMSLQRRAGKRAFATVMERAGRLDILVNNAGINVRKNIEEMPMESFDAMIAVNVKGPFIGIKHALPIMRAGGGGVILNMSSICGLVGHKFTNETYTTTKGALTMLTKSVAVRYAKDNIRCNSIHPSTVETALCADHVQGPGAQGGETGRNSSGKAGEHGRRRERAGLSGERRGIVHQRGCVSDRRRPDSVLGFAATVSCRRTGACCRNLRTRDGVRKPALGPLYWTAERASPSQDIPFSSVLESTDANLAWRGYACARPCGSAAAHRRRCCSPSPRGISSA